MKSLVAFNKYRCPQAFRVRTTHLCDVLFPIASTMMMKSSHAIAFFLFYCLLIVGYGFTSPQVLQVSQVQKTFRENALSQTKSSTDSTAEDSITSATRTPQSLSSMHSRTAFLSAMTVSLTTGSLVLDASEAWAKDVDPALKGTKKDPEYEACVSKCLFECTKPKVDGQKSRQECLPECKSSCATTKEQLMIGTPVKKD